MPNWCMNIIEIAGPEGEIAAIKAKLAEPYTIDGHAYTGDLLLMNMATPWRTDQERDTYRLNDNWYTLNITNWGTKWEVEAHLVATEISPTTVSYEFSSAWAPPLAAVQACSAAWPALRFCISFDEPGNDFAGRHRYVSGELVSLEEGGSRHFTCHVCDENSYCAWEDPLECDFAEADGNDWPHLLHALARLEATPEDLSARLAHADSTAPEPPASWVQARLAEAIMNSSALSTLPSRIMVLSALHGRASAWLSHALLAGLSPQDIASLCAHTDSGVREIASLGTVGYALAREP